MMLIAPFRGMLRRQLHKLKCAKGGLRRRQGGTRSMDLKRGSLAKHDERGLVLIGGSSGGRISIHDTELNKRITRSAKREDLKFLAYNHWKIRWPSRRRRPGLSILSRGK
jgi:hypothetical protein